MGEELIHVSGWSRVGNSVPVLCEVYRCDYCDGFILAFVTVSMRPRQTAATHQLKMVTTVTGIKKCDML